MAKILVAMSGGVDSSLVATLLTKQKHQVIGATMSLWKQTNPDNIGKRPCCTDMAISNARRVCAQLGIPHYVFHYEQEFRRYVVQYFIDEYARGYTPNPCIACNRTVKFHFLLERALELDFDMLATGHYARIEAPEMSGFASYTLLRGVDYLKDQSYVLYMLQQNELAYLTFPLGTRTKQEVREQAQAHGLATAHQSESQDICFIPNNDYRGFLQEEVPEVFVPGPILDPQGREIGQHRGLPNYTVGQRKGLGVTSATPLFVTGIDAARNALIVGDKEALQCEVFAVDNVHIVNEHFPDAPFSCQVQVRAHTPTFDAKIFPLPNQRLQINACTPQLAITPGQFAVLYDGERVIGGGRIITS